MTRGFSILWEFLIRADGQAEFERHYSPGGSWAALFRQAEGYLGTELLRDRGNRLRYLTIDRWTGIEAWQAFRERFAAQYKALDRQCQGLTERETLLGEHDRVA